MLLLSGLPAGCGSNIEWFPETGVFTNQSTGTQPAATPGKVMREIRFPTVVQWASDIAFDRNTGTFWMLASTIGAPPNPPNALVRINAATGASLGGLAANGWPVTIVDGSTLAFDGNFFWITSGGNSKVHQMGPDAAYLALYNCPATSTGLCQGLAWDNTTSSIWSVASDNANLARSQVLNGVLLPTPQIYGNLWSGSGLTDVSFDSATGQVFVIKNGVILVQGSSGTGLGTISFTVPGSGRGDWDGRYFWVVDNTSKSIKALFVR